MAKDRERNRGSQGSSVLPGGVLKSGFSGVVQNPAIKQRPTYNGSSAYTSVINNVDVLFQPMLITVPLMYVNWGLTSIPNAFPPLDTVVAGTIAPLYGSILTAAQVRGKNQWRNPNLQDPLSIIRWLDIATECLIGIRALEACINAPLDNLTTQLIAQVANNVPLNAIVSAGRALRTIPLPQGFVDHFDRCSGFKYDSPEDTYFLYGMVPIPVEVPGTQRTTPNAADPTTLFTIAGLLETQLGVLRGVGAGADAQDFTNIYNLFSVAYGLPKYDLKIATKDAGEKMMYFNAPVSARDDEGAVWSYPIVDEQHSTLHLMFPRNEPAADSKPELSLLSWTGWAIGTDPQPAPQNIAALLGTIDIVEGVGHNAHYGVHDQNSTYQDINCHELLLDTNPIFRGCDANRYLVGISQEFTLATQWAADGRIWEGMDDFQVAIGVLVDSTQYAVIDMFINGVRPRFNSMR